MADKFNKFDLNQIQTYPLATRKNLVDKKNFGQPVSKSASFNDFFASLPEIQAGKNLRKLVNSIVKAKETGKTVIFAMGAHPVKCGVSPYLIELINRNIIDVLAVNGALLIHDLEIATIGQTSEDVRESLKTGQFGMAAETSTIINEVINRQEENALGLGTALGKEITERNFPYQQSSITVACHQKGIPMTVHIGIGTDINHLHPGLQGEALGRASHEDFRIFISAVSSLNDGGVFVNIGSAVIIPEVFLKAISAARSSGLKVEQFTTANFDFIQHYRPTRNIIQRPVENEGSQGIAITGHHEIMVPILAQAILEHYS